MYILCPLLGRKYHALFPGVRTKKHGRTPEMKINFLTCGGMYFAKKIHSVERSGLSKLILLDFVDQKNTFLN